MSRIVRKVGASVGEHVLDNGLRVLIAERHSDPVVSTLLAYAVGSRHENEREAGLSHFLEHMMFKGSRRYAKGEIDRLTTEMGGSNNAFTSNDHTAYWFELASDRWESALDIELDRLRHPLLDAREFASEREVVLEELAMSEDDPWQVLSRRVEAALFQRHPYGRPIIGTREALRALEPEDLRAWHARHYRVDNAVLVIAGDVRRADALAAAERRFGALRAAPREAQPAFVARPEPPAGEMRVSMRWTDPATRLCVAWPTVRVGTHEDEVLDVITALLSSGRMSRLQRKLVFDTSLATLVSVNNDTRVDGGAFWLFAEAAQGVDADALERAIDAQLELLARERVPQAELERVRSILRALDAFDGESVSGIAQELGSAAVDDDWRKVLDGGARCARIGADEVQRVARELLGRERRVVGTCLPKQAALRGSRAR